MRSVKMTIDAITDNCTIILTLEGIIFLNSEITVFEIHNTAITARVITNAMSNLVVTASAEQIPRTCKLMDCCSSMGLIPLLWMIYLAMPLAIIILSNPD